MRIVIVSNYRLKAEVGTAMISESLAKHLSIKNKVLYVCLGTKYRYRNLKNKYDILEIPSVPIKQGYVAKLTPDIVNQIYKDLRFFSPDIIHAQNVVFVALICQIWALKNSIPFVVTFHSMPSEGIKYMYPKLLKNKVVSTINYSLTKSYIQNLLKYTDLTIALNEYVGASILSVKKTALIKKINNGIELDSFYLLKIKTLQNIKQFVYIGSYTERKNQEFLLKAFSHLPNNFRLNLYGNKKTGEDYVKKLSKIVKSRKIKNVRINNFLGRKGVLKVLENADYFVTASIKEVQSLAIIEALASGTPVIGLKNETLNEVIDERNGLSLNKDVNPRIFANKLKQYVEKNKDGYVRNTNYCRESIKKFDINTVVNEILKTYEKVINDKRKKKSQYQNSQFANLIPEQFRALFQSYSEVKPPKTTRLGILLGISMIVSIISSPFIELSNLIRFKFVPAVRKAFT